MAESGLIQSVMVHSLRAFRDDPDLLLNTMDVFVKEPSLDWKVERLSHNTFQACKQKQIAVFLIATYR